MADDLSVPDELKQRFSASFDSIVSLTKSLGDRIDQINKLNVHAAGEKDSIAKAYHSQVDKPTHDLSQLVDSIALLFEISGENGVGAAETLNKGEDEASTQAQSWDPSHE